MRAMSNVQQDSCNWNLPIPHYKMKIPKEPDFKNGWDSNSLQRNQAYTHWEIHVFKRDPSTFPTKSDMFNVRFNRVSFCDLNYKRRDSSWHNCYHAVLPWSKTQGKNRVILFVRLVFLDRNKNPFADVTAVPLFRMVPANVSIQGRLRLDRVFGTVNCSEPLWAIVTLKVD